LFKGNADQEGRRKMMEEKLKDVAKVPLPIQIKRHFEVSDKLGSPQKNASKIIKVKDTEPNKDIYEKLSRRSPRKTKDWGALPKLNKDPM
jgi:hypothetical protein